VATTIFFDTKVPSVHYTPCHEITS